MLAANIFMPYADFTRHVADDRQRFTPYAAAMFAAMPMFVFAFFMPRYMRFFAFTIAYRC